MTKICLVFAAARFASHLSKPLSWKIRNIAADEAEIMFGMLDQDGSDTISREEFKNFGFATMLQFTKVEENENFIERHFPHVTTSGWYQVSMEG